MKRKSQKAKKPKKPRRDFPLFAHQNGQWAKKVLGKIYYFGVWADPQAAERAWDEQKADLLSGSLVVSEHSISVTVKELCNLFLTHQKRRLKSHEIEARQYEDSHRATIHIADALGRQTSVDDIRPLSFDALHIRLTDRYSSPKSLKREIGNIKAVFRFAEEREILSRTIRFGTLKSPSASEIRKYEQRKRDKHGEMFFSAEQCRQLIDNARVNLRTMILFGLNCGFGNTDIGLFKLSNVDLQAGWIDYPRPKTGIDRVSKLWNVTVESLQEYLTMRPIPGDHVPEGTVFVTCRGNSFASESSGNQPVGDEFTKLTKKLGIYRKGLTFYSLRRTYRTVADSCLDQPAINLSMGHTDPTMGAVYRQHISRDRIERVATHVHNWLIGNCLSSTGGVRHGL